MSSRTQSSPAQRVVAAANSADHSLPDWLIAELRSDHAGETGAVMIYRGILAVSKDAKVIRFAKHHLVTEEKHLGIIEAILAPQQQTRLLPLWRVMGWLTGALPALFGANAVYGTIAAVETFVDHHYQQQIERLSDRGPYADIRATLVSCQADEIAHRDEAMGLVGPEQPMLLTLWKRIVSVGSQAAVLLAKRV